MRGADPLSAEAAPWYQGAVGEIAVGAILARLGPEWTVLHAVPVGEQGADIDHVLIGPPGVFTLNTKHHTAQSIWVAGRTLMVGGQKQPYIPKAFHEATRATKLLSAAVGESVPVNGVLVLVDPRCVTIREDPAGVAVVTDRQLIRWLTLQPPVLTPAQVSRIAVVAARPTTWTKHHGQTRDPAVLQEVFEALERQVRVARRLRRAWRLGARSVRTGARASARAEKALLRGLLHLALAMFLLGMGLTLLGFLA
ncbi:nuclease-related domain-containing protein [Kocuria sp. U4B]